MNKDQAFARFAETRQNFLAAVARLTPEDLAHKPVEGIWTAQDLIGHLRSWEAVCLEPLRDFAVGGKFTPEAIPDHLAWNDQQALIWQQKSLEQLWAEFHQTRQALVELLQGLPDSALETAILMPWGETGPVLNMVSGLAWHENEHTQSIWRALETEPAHE